MNKKGQTSVGTITTLVVGIGTLILLTIILLIIIGTISPTTSGLIPLSSQSTTNETDGVSTSANSSGYTLAAASLSASPRNFAITAAWNDNSTGFGDELPLANVSVNPLTGVVVNGTVTEYDNVSLSYTYQTDPSSVGSVRNLEQNFTEGIDNVSSKIPTILLIGAVVLLFGILALLVIVYRRMQFGGGDSI